MNLTQAKSIVGNLGFSSKMPGTSFALPAVKCITGVKLAKVAGSSCSLCYALKDRWLWPNPQKSMQRRLAGITHPLWVDAMVKLLTHTHRNERIRVDLGAAGVRLQKLGGQRWRWNVSGFHRWHDSGDIQSVEHLAKICEIAALTPKIKHWLPTQELGMVRAYLANGGSIPDNLTIRVSSIMIDDQTRRNWPQTSSVFRDIVPENTHICPAPEQDHRCGSCRACWDRNIPHVAYRLH